MPNKTWLEAAFPPKIRFFPLRSKRGRIPLAEPVLQIRHVFVPGVDARLDD